MAARRTRSDPFGQGPVGALARRRTRRFPLRGMTPALVIGRSGQPAPALAARSAAEGRPLVFAGRPDVDLEDADSLRHAVLSSGAGIVINAAAYTAVDQAEDEPDRAWAQNPEA